MPTTILLADSSATNRKLVRRTLINEGMRVLTVDDGEAAIRRLDQISPDLVIADISLPGKNGYAVCDYVKSALSSRNMPVILIAGAFEHFDHAEARKVHADAHLIKPCESRVLVEVVRRLVAGPGAKGRPWLVPLSGFDAEIFTARIAREPVDSPVSNFNLPAREALPQPEVNPAEEPASALQTSEQTTLFFDRYVLQEGGIPPSASEQIIEEESAPLLKDESHSGGGQASETEAQRFALRAMRVALAFLILVVIAGLVYEFISLRQARWSSPVESTTMPSTSPGEPNLTLPAGELPPPPLSVASSGEVEGANEITPGEVVADKQTGGIIGSSAASNKGVERRGKAVRERAVARAKKAPVRRDRQSGSGRLAQRFARALDLENRGMFEQAEAQYRAILRDFPDDPATRFSLNRVRKRLSTRREQRNREMRSVRDAGLGKIN